MPFKSEKQRKFMWSKHPEIAHKWSDKYGSGIVGAYRKKRGKK
jgi:hypothetical protein